MVQAVVDTCRACRTWTRPGPRAVSRYRLATAFNELVQWDICFVYEDALSHLIDECTRYSKLAILPPPEPKSAETIIQTITRSWLRHFGPMRYLAADGESGLSSAAAAQWAHRHNIELKVKAPRAHAWMVERHHELFRQIVHRTKSQLESEGIVLLPEDLYAECNFVKNAMISIGGVTPMQAVLGQNPPLLADFEPRSDVPCDDSDGVSRNVHRAREVALTKMIERTAVMRIERAQRSKTRTAVESMELAIGDEVDFHRPMGTKDEPGWRGPATLTEITDGQAVVKMQGRFHRVQAAELRRS
jgi:hypothetical protein